MSPGIVRGAPVKGITIKDVAARAGVSAKTVSRVINGENHVRAAVREAVQRVVAELDYRPNAFARGLSSSRSFLVGLFFHEASTAYAADVQRGAVARCRQLSHHLVVEEVDRDRPNWAASLAELRLAGAVLAPPACDWPELLDALEEAGVPAVRIAPAREPERAARVLMDDRAAARELTEHLLALGHRDVAFIRGNPTHSAAVLRGQGFADAMRAAGLPVPEARVLEGDFTFRAGLAAAEAILAGGAERGGRPTAVFASNDEMALAVLTVAMRHGVSVPGELTVVGFDDAQFSRIAWPQLTTVRQPNAEMAAAAVSMLLGPAEGRAPGAAAELPYSLVIRASSGPPSRPVAPG